MRRDSRLSSTLHAILHIAGSRQPMTSEDLAYCMRTNSAVVRRTMAGLRDAGIVTSSKGHGGGWQLARELADISLYDVQVALGDPALFGFDNHLAEPTCLLEQVVNAALDETRSEAEKLLRSRMAQIRLSDLAAQFDSRLLEHKLR